MLNRNPLTREQQEYQHACGLLPTNRIEALTDGVYAIAMTRLALTIRFPEAHPGGGDVPVLLYHPSFRY